MWSLVNSLFNQTLEDLLFSISTTDCYVVKKFTADRCSISFCKFSLASISRIKIVKRLDISATIDSLLNSYT